MWVGANARVRMFGGFVILPSHFGVAVAGHGGNGEPLHTGCRSPSIDSKHHSAAAPKEYVCRDKNSPCRPKPWFLLLKYRHSRIFRGSDEPEFFPELDLHYFPPIRKPRLMFFLLPPCWKDAPSLK